MVKQEYRDALKVARRELQEAMGQRADIDKRIFKLKQTVESLNALCHDVDVEELAAEMRQQMAGIGLTNAVRRLLADSKMPLSATEVRDGIARLGVDLSAYANDMAVVHNTLNRLARQGDILSFVDNNGQMAGWGITEKGRAGLRQ